MIDASAELLERIIVSAGKPGLQMKLSPTDFARVAEAPFIDIIKDSSHISCLLATIRLHINSYQLE